MGTLTVTVTIPEPEEQALGAMLCPEEQIATALRMLAERIQAIPLYAIEKIKGAGFKPLTAHAEVEWGWTRSDAATRAGESETPVLDTLRQRLAALNEASRAELSGEKQARLRMNTASEELAALNSGGAAFEWVDNGREACVLFATRPPQEIIGGVQLSSNQWHGHVKTDSVYIGLGCWLSKADAKEAVEAAARAAKSAEHSVVKPPEPLFGEELSNREVPAIWKFGDDLRSAQLWWGNIKVGEYAFGDGFYHAFTVVPGLSKVGEVKDRLEAVRAIESALIDAARETPSSDGAEPEEGALNAAWTGTDSTVLKSSITGAVLGGIEMVNLGEWVAYVGSRRERRTLDGQHRDMMAARKSVEAAVRRARL